MLWMECVCSRSREGVRKGGGGETEKNWEREQEYAHPFLSTVGTNAAFSSYRY